MLESDFTKEERWIMIYFTILNGYFANVPNYIFDRVEKIVDLMKERNISRDAYTKLLEDFIKECDLSDGNIFLSDYLYYDTFYKVFEGIDFLKIYIDSTKAEQEELKEYVNRGRKDRAVTKEQTCTISYKYKSTGSYIKSTLIDNAKIQYFTLMILGNEFKDYMDFFEYILLKYSEMYKIDISKLLEFIDLHQDVYKLIYEEVFGIVQYSLNFRRDNEFEQIEINIGEKIDDTDVNSVETYNKVSTVLKRLAKTNSNYRCELEDYFNCQYFTSKESHKNYVEVHHLIPRAVGNDFENSIEVVENYVALCPHCHRLLHFGEDVERKPALHNLYIKRKDKLKEKGLDITEQELKEYYLIER